MSTPQPYLPFVAGREPRARRASARTATAIVARQPGHLDRYRALLDQVSEAGITDHGAAAALHLPLSSINSLRHRVAKRWPELRVVAAAGTDRTQFGGDAQRWRLVRLAC
jgi:hypothetical protein